jgi:hypothetical protein
LVVPRVVEAWVLAWVLAVEALAPELVWAEEWVLE